MLPLSACVQLLPSYNPTLSPQNTQGHNTLSYLGNTYTSVLQRFKNFYIFDAERGLKNIMPQ